MRRSKGIRNYRTSKQDRLWPQIEFVIKVPKIVHWSILIIRNLTRKLYLCLCLIQIFGKYRNIGNTKTSKSTQMEKSLIIHQLGSILFTIEILKRKLILSYLLTEQNSSVSASSFKMMANYHTTFNNEKFSSIIL